MSVDLRRYCGVRRRVGSQLAKVERIRKTRLAKRQRAVSPTSHYWGPCSRIEESSSAGEFHPHALPEPDVNLSIHPALIVQPSVASPFANGQIDWVKRLLLIH